ncbi:glutathione hydrolase 1 proenzyme-like isoform X2 [Patiria miniata]|uniref:Uncharacterized protein n=1 Tax=Patiria miniata TaxID=46514 RepID=A0A914AY41_PATMI|nr:glutathione hydrolase 1 proenzyme-like isoform X2 [Patiria miniata]
MSRKRCILGACVVVVVILAAVGLTLGLTLGLRDKDDTSPQVGQTPASTAAPSVTSPPFPTGLGVYRRAAVATDYGPCSEMARDILQDGGSAVDAAVTATLCLGVASPQSSGLGGGLFMVIYGRNGSTETINAYQTAPAAADFDMFVDDTDQANYRARAICVPGELAGLWAAHQKYGVLPWKQLVTPVINMAEHGFPLAWHTAYCLKILQKKFNRWPILRELYTKPDGSLMESGDNITAPAGLVQTLRAIAEGGVTALYGGDVGRKLVQDVRDQGGIMTLEDLTSYNVTWEDPVVLNMGEGQRRVMSTPVTSSGNLVQFTVSIMDECNLASVNLSSYEGKLKMYHYFIEASTFAIGLRLHSGDFGKAETKKSVAALSSKEYARTICSKINETYVTYPSGRDYDTFNDLPETSRADPALEQADEGEAVDTMNGDTSHLSVYSEQGDAVSMTTSVGRYFGSRTFSNQTGIFLNGHMGNLYYNGRSPSWEANRLAPGARVMSTMSPSIIADEGGALGIIGSSGGLRIISTNAWVLLRSLWGSESLSEMIDSPRVYPYRSVSVSRTYYEKDFPEDLVEGLKAMGHNMVSTSSFAAAQGILRGPGPVIQAHSDRRKHGYPAGY